MKKYEIYLLAAQECLIIHADRVSYDPELTRFQIYTDGQYDTKAVFATKNIIGWEEVK